MFHFDLRINFPWKRDPIEFNYVKVFKVTKHKSFIFDLSRYHWNSMLGFSFDTRWRQDHGGIYFCLDVWGISFEASFSDNRHWDRKKGEYINYDESIIESNNKTSG